MKIQSDIHECLLANTSDLQHYGVKRVQHATCNYYLKWSNCKKLASLSCERCDFDLCESCSGLAKLPLEERNERKRKYDNIEKVRKEEEQKRRKLEFDKREAERQQKDQLKNEKENCIKKIIETASESIKKPNGINKNKNNLLDYVVWSSCGYDYDGWHSYEGPPSKEFDSSYSTKKEANNRAVYLFYKKNPWGWDVLQILDEDNEVSDI